MARLQFAAGGAFTDTVEKLSERLDDNQIKAAVLFVQDLYSGAGFSGGLVSSYSERVQCTTVPDKRRAHWSDNGDRAAQIIASLSAADKETLDWMMKRSEYKEAERTMAGIGRRWSGYADNQYAAGFVVGRISSLLSHMSRMYDYLPGTAPKRRKPVVSAGSAVAARAREQVPAELMA